MESNYWFHPLFIKKPGSRLQGKWPSAEHLYQYVRAVACRAPPNILRKIKSATTPELAGHYSGKVEAPLHVQKWWKRHRVAVMKAVLQLKYSQCQAFRDALDPAKDYFEWTTDSFWGVGPKACIETRRIPGANVMGRLLTHLARWGTLEDINIPAEGKSNDACDNWCLNDLDNKEMDHVDDLLQVVVPTCAGGDGPLLTTEDHAVANRHHLPPTLFKQTGATKERASENDTGADKTTKT